MTFIPYTLLEEHPVAKCILDRIGHGTLTVFTARWQESFTPSAEWHRIPMLRPYSTIKSQEPWPGSQSMMQTHISQLDKGRGWTTCRHSMNGESCEEGSSHSRALWLGLQVAKTKREETVQHCTAETTSASTSIQRQSKSQKTMQSM